MGDHLIVGHTDLDKRVRVIAAQLNVELPNQPNAQQQGWLQEMTAATGAEYERKFVNLLRAAHGKIFPAIGAVRNSTRNTLVRQLASDANQTVLDHITILEKTGSVDFDAIANDTAALSTASPTGPRRRPPASRRPPRRRCSPPTASSSRRVRRPRRRGRSTPPGRSPRIRTRYCGSRWAASGRRRNLKCCSERPATWVRPRFPGP